MQSQSSGRGGRWLSIPLAALALVAPAAPALAAVPAAAPAAAPGPSLADARTRKLDGAIEDAAAIAQAVLGDPKRKKEHAAAALLLGRIRYEEGRYAEAAVALRRAATGPLVASALYYLGESLFWSGEHAAARAELKKILDRYPTSPWAPRAKLRTADALLAEGRWAAAASAYQDLLAKWPRYPRRDALTFALAQALAGRGARGAAAETWRTVWVRWPTSPLAAEAERALARLGERALPGGVTDAERIERARTLRWLREHEACERELGALAAEVAARPGGGGELAWTVAWERALNTLAAGDAPKAVDAMASLARTAPASMEHYVGDVVAGARARAGDVAPLAAEYEEHVTLAKTPWSKRLAHLAAARFYLEYGDYPALRRHVEPLAKDAPKGGEIAWLLAWAAFREGRWDAARNAFKDYCAARRWDTERCMYWSARAAEKGGARAEAIAGYEDLVLRSPFSYYALLSRSRLGGLGSTVPPLGTADALAALARDATGGAGAGSGADPEGEDAGAGEGPAAADDALADPRGPEDAAARAAELADILGTLGHGDEAFGALGGRPAPADDAVWAAAAKKYGSAAPGLARAYELWKLGFVADARDELQGLYLLLAATRGWTIPVTVARRGWSDEGESTRVARGGRGADEDADEVPEATAVEAPLPAAKPDALASLASVAPAAGPALMSAADPLDAAATAVAAVPTAPPAGAAPAAPKPAAAAPIVDRIGPVDAKFVPTLGRLFAAVGDVHYSRRLIGAVPGSAPADRLMRVYPRAYAPTVERAAAAHELDPAIIWAVMHTESAFHPYVVSGAGARGLMQVMPRTGLLIARALGKPGFDPDTLFDTELSIDYGAWYLRELIDKFRGQLVIALAAYNGGPRAVERWLDAKAHSAPEVDEFIEEVPWTQSREYAKKVLAKIAVYRYLYGGARAFELSCALDTVCEPNIDF